MRTKKRVGSQDNGSKTSLESLKMSVGAILPLSCLIFCQCPGSHFEEWRNLGINFEE